MKLFAVISVPDDDYEPECATYWADDCDHAEEQHLDCNSSCIVSWVIEIPNTEVPNDLDLTDKNKVAEYFAINY